MSRSRYAFDSKGFTFSLKCLALFISLATAVQNGTAIAASLIHDEEQHIQTSEIPTEKGADIDSILLERLDGYRDSLATKTIGTASIEALTQSHERLIAVDLKEMKLYLFEGGTTTATYPILSKGKRGSRWETPTGLYKIETKEVEHFSSIGEVHMPYSMQFFGNFFIHGWPYYPDGAPVPEGYSGGCIRLSTEDAERVFAFASRETPVFIWEEYESNAAVAIDAEVRPPRVSAQSYLVADIRTGTIYAARSASAALPIASLTKLVTALVANETIHFNRTLTISDEDRKKTEGTPGSLPADKSFEAGDLLYPLIMESNNTVAYTLAQYFGSQNFMRWMNDKAHAIGMSQTFFEDPSGISPHNVSSARDLFVLMRYIHNSQSFLLAVSRETEKSILSIDGDTYPLRNLNVFADNHEFLGGKTGYTQEAQQTMAAVFELPAGSATSTVAFIVLGSKDRKKDIDALRAWFKRAAQSTTPKNLGLK